MRSALTTQRALLAVALLGAAVTARPQVAGSLLDPRFSGTQMEHGGPPRVGVGSAETFHVRLAAGGTGVRRLPGSVMIADRLAVEHADGSIWVEAENAERLLGAGDPPATALIADEDCGNGTYVRNPRFLAVPFRIRSEGEREVWLRVRVGAQQHHLCFWGVDGSRRRLTYEPSSPTDGGSEGDAVRHWQWVRAGECFLSAGDHRFQVERFPNAELELDRIALSPVAAPPPQGVGKMGRTEVPPLGQVWSREVTPPALAGLAAVRMVGEAHGGSLAYEVSLDAGATWSQARDGNLSGVEVRGDGTDRVTLRATLSRSPEGLSPELKALALTVHPAPDGWLAARNDFLRILVDRRTGRLFRITDVMRDRELIWPDEPASLFAADLKKRGSSQWLRYSHDATSRVTLTRDRRGQLIDDVVKAEGLDPTLADEVAGTSVEPAVFVEGEHTPRGLALDFSVQQDVRVQLRMLLDNTPQSLWSVEVRNEHPDLDLIRLQFPVLRHIRVGSDGFDDEELRMQSFGHRRRCPGLGPLRAATYPGSVLPWESVSDERGGLGLTVRDPAFGHVRFASSREAAFGDTFSLSLEKRGNVRAGGGRATWEYALAVHPGRWHWVADRYREWAVQHLDRPQYPRWFDDSDGYFFYAVMNTGLPFRDMGTLARDAKRLGLHHVQIWGQFTDLRYGCCGPYWMPSPRYGTIEEFRQGIADIHAEGCKVGFYFLHDRVDLYHAEGSHVYGFIGKDEFPVGTEFPTPELLDRVQLVTDPAGETRPYPLSDEEWAAYREAVRAHQEDTAAHPAPTKWHPVDQGDPVWWEYMRHWAVDKYVEEWGADGHYYDVLGCGSPRESFDLRKGHHGHGLHGVGKAGLARTTVASARERGHADYFLLQEGLNDIPGQYTAGLNTSLYYNQTGIVRYTWPDYVIFDDQCGQGSRNMMRVVEMGFLNGNRLGVRLVNHVMADVVDARSRIRNWLHRSRFLDTLGVESPVPARLLLRRDPGCRGAVITFLNRSRANGTVRVNAARVGDVQRAIGLDTSGATFGVPLRRESGSFLLALPTAKLSAVVLAEDVAVEHGLIAGVEVLRDPASPRIVLSAANLTETAVAGVFACRELGPLAPVSARPQFDCPPGGVVHVEIPVDTQRLAGRFVRPAVDLIVGGERVASASRASFPLVEDPSFEETGNDENMALDGRRSLRLDPAEGFSCRILPLYLAPSRRYRISLAYRRTAGAAKGSFARAFERPIQGKLAPKATLFFTRDDVWDRVSAEFASSRAFLSHVLYVYNTDSERTAWIDEVRLDDLGPVDTPDADAQ